MGYAVSWIFGSTIVVSWLPHVQRQYRYVADDAKEKDFCSPVEVHVCEERVSIVVKFVPSLLPETVQDGGACVEPKGADCLLVIW